MEVSVAYAREREVFRRPIGANQAIAHPLAQAHMQLVAAWQVARHAAWRYDRGLDCGEAAQTAKYLAAEASFLAADRAVQTLGGMGYATEGSRALTRKGFTELGARRVLAETMAVRA